MMRSWGCSRAVYTMKFAGEPECGCTLTPHSAGSNPNSASARVCTAHPWPAQPGPSSSIPRSEQAPLYQRRRSAIQLRLQRSAQQVLQLARASIAADSTGSSSPTQKMVDAVLRTLESARTSHSAKQTELLEVL